MPLTTNGLPYPADTAAPNVPADIQALAEALDKYARATVFGNYARTVNQTPVATATQVAVIGSQVSAEGGITLNGTTGEVTIPAAGLYLLTGWAAFTANATGYRYAWWTKNGARIGYLHWPTPNASTEFSVTSTVLARCAAGDKVSYLVQHNAGISLELLGASQLTGYQVARIAP